MISVQRFLTLALVITITLVLATSQWQSFRDIRHEVEEVFDAQLAQYARLLLKSEVVDSFNHTSKPLVTDILDFPQLQSSTRENDEATPLGHKYERKIAFQIWRNGHLAIRSLNAPEDPWGESLRPGYHNSQIDGHLWRIFILHNKANATWIAVGERGDIRNEISQEILAEGLAPLLIAIVLIWLIVTVVVRYGLRPLITLARDLHLRRSNNLSPIRLQRTPHELNDVVLAINRLFQRLQNALQRERAFTSDAAHELRTPIAAMKIHLDNLQSAASAGESKTSIAELDKALMRSAQLIEQLLTLARLDPEIAELETTPVRLAPLLRETWNDLKSLNQDKQLRLSVEGDSRVAIDGAVDLLRVLFSNLLRNCIVHAPANSTVIANLAAVENGVALSITDQGPGIPAATRERVVDRFYRTEDSKLRDNDGAGLGLAIALRIARLHGAELILEDSPSPPGLQVRLLFPTPTGEQEAAHP